jgi:hypothetical protein
MHELRPVSEVSLDRDEPLLSPEKARTLLRRLRDLNLSTGPIAIGRGRTAIIGGCLSLDAPAENGVRYRVCLDDGSESVLELFWDEHDLALSLLDQAPALAKRSLAVALSCDRQGRACARALAARVLPESRDRLELEHFLRRVLRTLLRG